MGGASLDASTAPLEMHREDGTPLDFSSRDAKQEALRQKKLEQAYEAEQAAWGLPSSVSTQATPPLPPPVAAGGGGVSVATFGAMPRAASGTALPLPPLGRGRHVVRPAWLVRMERGRGSN